MKKRHLLVSLIAAFAVFFGAFAMPAAAWDWGGPKLYKAYFYLLKEGLPVPVGTAPEPNKNYTYVGSGHIKVPENYYNADGVDDRIKHAPPVKLEDGQSILWYVIKSEDGVWHVDGVITPYYSFLYDPNVEDAQGETTDGVHYYEDDTAVIQENGYTREGYTFTGWNTKADGTGVPYQPGQRIEIDDDMFGASESINVLTLYAQWEKNEPDPEPEEPDAGEGTGETIGLGIVTPKKMSVRFEDGTIYYGGETIDIEIGRTYRFQMCSNNWENDVYDDGGNGLCGTVVYSVRVSDRYDERSYDEATHTFVLPKGDPVLRTDVNSCFMAYRYHFTKGDYNKQTGIPNVVDPPLESLSVNLPLGSTVKSDAYRGFAYVDSDYVFIQRGEDLAESYTDYYWEY